MQEPREMEAARLTAFHALPDVPSSLRIVPAVRWREWMNATTNKFANRCLPLLMANESGWMLLNPIPFEAEWDGTEGPAAIKLMYDAGAPNENARLVNSIFGHGILTWAVPYLFRTPPGYNLLARGPANWPKDGLCALEGVVETDWATATFTMNWKFTRPGRVRFEADEPFCMIVPQRRGELESFHPEIRDVRSDPSTAKGWQRWAESRDEIRRQKFLGVYSGEHEQYRDAWEKDYFRGRGADGREAPAHQTKLRLREFARGTG
jgi:uncharacterized protein DUF6065